MIEYFYQGENLTDLRGKLNALVDQVNRLTGSGIGTAKNFSDSSRITLRVLSMAGSNLVPGDVVGIGDPIDEKPSTDGTLNADGFQYFRDIPVYKVIERANITDSNVLGVVLSTIMPNMFGEVVIGGVSRLVANVTDTSHTTVDIDSIGNVISSEGGRIKLLVMPTSTGKQWCDVILGAQGSGGGVQVLGFSGILETTLAAGTTASVIDTNPNLVTPIYSAGDYRNKRKWVILDENSLMPGPYIAGTPIIAVPVDPRVYGATVVPYMVTAVGPTSNLPAGYDVTQTFRRNTDGIGGDLLIKSASPFNVYNSYDGESSSSYATSRRVAQSTTNNELTLTVDFPRTFRIRSNAKQNGTTNIAINGAIIHADCLSITTNRIAAAISGGTNADNATVITSASLPFNVSVPSDLKEYNSKYVLQYVFKNTQPSTADTWSPCVGVNQNLITRNSVPDKAAKCWTRWLVAGVSTTPAKDMGYYVRGEA